MATKPMPTEPSPNAAMLTVPEVAWVTRLSITTVYERLREGRIRSITDGGRRLVPREAVAEYWASFKATGTEDPGHNRGRARRKAA